MWATRRRCTIRDQLLLYTCLASSAVLLVGAIAWAALSSGGAGGAGALVFAAAGVATAAVAALGALVPRRIARQLERLTAEAGRLEQAVGEGRVDVRCDTAGLSHELASAVGALNGALDAFIAPILVAAECVERIGRGDVPAPIADEYRGEFESLRQNLNQCIGAVTALLVDTDRLASAAVAGELSTRADPSRHQGDFRRIVDGVNRALDAVGAPIGEAAEVLEKLAARDLRVRVEGIYLGDHARVKDAVNGTAGALQSSLGRVARSVEDVSGAAGLIAASSQGVAEGASRQASALEETGASLESIAATTRRSAESARRADALARAARGAAAEGVEATHEMAGAMVRIKAAARGTSQIIQDVTEIAFQTNLLALNAAVEAARAGSAGRGFAVVAEEVRSLAQRAKAAARNTEALIRQSVSEAEAGEGTARRVKEKLGEIGASVEKVTSIVAEMAASAKEQAAALEQVNGAVAEVATVTQDNARSSQESSAAAAKLSEKALDLAGLLATFELGDGEGDCGSVLQDCAGAAEVVGEIAGAGAAWGAGARSQPEPEPGAGRDGMVRA